MNAMLGRVESAYERQEEFVADAAHELRSPLAALRTNLEVGLRSAEPGAAGRDERLLADVLRMQRLVDDLLALARASGPMAAAHQPLIDLDDLVLAEVRRASPPEGVLIDASRVSAAAVRGAADQLARGVRNLIENAVRHAATRVTVSLREDAAGIRLTVEDDGPGIPPEAHDRVFERFTRLDDSRARDTGGAGLGLAITRRIVEDHGGSVSVDPAYTAGARFVVMLPHPAA